MPTLEPQSVERSDLFTLSSAVICHDEPPEAFGEEETSQTQLPERDFPCEDTQNM